MKNLPIYTKEQLRNTSLNAITDVANYLATELGLKVTKRFASKDKAVARTLQNQELWLEENKPDVSETPDKSNKIHGLVKVANLTSILNQAKEGSIENSLHAGIRSGENTVDKLVAYIVEHHKRPRSSRPVDAQYATHNIKWFVNKDNLGLDE